ncbi:unnamed protein product [Amoebophrya sp. A120]|nr:unnamed protein product [Amoebophrya sp. A120]|eukprot:GSA120T00001283001.1
MTLDPGFRLCVTSHAPSSSSSAFAMRRSATTSTRSHYCPLSSSSCPSGSTTSQHVSGFFNKAPYYHVQQVRFYVPVGRKSWSLQNHRIRQPRPLMDRFAMHREHREKEWWRERRIAPATFMGFPDVTKYDLRGGSLYTEQMDAVTLAVILDKCVTENVIGIKHQHMWEQFSWRAQQLSLKTVEPDLCYIFRAFARADFFDTQFFCTFVGRIQRRLQYLNIKQTNVVFEALTSSPRFRYEKFEKKLVSHVAELLHVRDDTPPDDLSKLCALLYQLNHLEVCELCCDQLASRDLGAALAVEEQAVLLEVVVALDEERRFQLGEFAADFSEGDDSACRELMLVLLQTFETKMDSLKADEFRPLCRALAQLESRSASTNGASYSNGNINTFDRLLQKAIETCSAKLKEALLDPKVLPRMSMAAATECAFFLQRSAAAGAVTCGAGPGGGTTSSQLQLTSTTSTTTNLPHLAVELSHKLVARTRQCKPMDLARLAHCIFRFSDFEMYANTLLKRLSQLNASELALLRTAFAAREGDYYAGQKLSRPPAHVGGTSASLSAPSYSSTAIRSELRKLSSGPEPRRLLKAQESGLLNHEQSSSDAADNTTGAGNISFGPIAVPTFLSGPGVDSVVESIEKELLTKVDDLSLTDLAVLSLANIFPTELLQPEEQAVPASSGRRVETTTGALAFATRVVDLATEKLERELLEMRAERMRNVEKNRGGRKQATTTTLEEEEVTAFAATKMNQARSDSPVVAVSPGDLAPAQASLLVQPDNTEIAEVILCILKGVSAVERTCGTPGENHHAEQEFLVQPCSRLHSLLPLIAENLHNFTSAQALKLLNLLSMMLSDVEQPAAGTTTGTTRTTSTRPPPASSPMETSTLQNLILANHIGSFKDLPLLDLCVFAEYSKAKLSAAQLEELSFAIERKCYDLGRVFEEKVVRPLHEQLVGMISTTQGQHEEERWQEIAVDR